MLAIIQLQYSTQSDSLIFVDPGVIKFQSMHMEWAKLDCLRVRMG